MKCEACKKHLSATDSLIRGMGKKCADKFAGGIQAAGWSLTQFDALASLSNPEVDGKLLALKRATAANDQYFIKKYLSEALSIAESLPPSNPVESKTEFSCTACGDTGRVSDREILDNGISFRIENDCKCKAVGAEPESELCGACNDVFCLCSLKEAA